MPLGGVVGLKLELSSLKDPTSLEQVRNSRLLLISSRRRSTAEQHANIPTGDLPE